MNWSDAQQLLKVIGHNVRTYRIKANLTQGDLAQKTNGALGRTSIVNIEAGKQKMTLLTAFTLANALEISVADLVATVPITEHVEVVIGGVPRLVTKEVAEELMRLAEEVPNA